MMSQQNTEKSRSANIKQWLLPLVVLLLAYLLVQIMMASKQETPRKQGSSYKPVVEIMPVQLSTLSLSVDSQGTVQAKQRIDVVSEVAGSVIWVSPQFVDGGHIKAGETLLKIEPISYQVAVAEAKATVAKTRLNLIDERAEYKRGSLYKNQNNRSQKNNGSELRKHKLALVEAEFEASKARLREAEYKLDETVIKAPFDALVSNKRVDLGQFVSISNILLSLQGVNVAEIRLPVTAAELVFLKSANERARVELSSYFGALKKTWSANIVRIENFVNNDTRVFNVIAEVESPYEMKGLPLSMGLFVEAAIEGKNLEQAIRVPRSSVHGNHVFVVVHDRLERRAVNVYRQEKQFIVINKGLVDGDSLVLTRLDLMIDGMPVLMKAAQLNNLPSSKVAELNKAGNGSHNDDKNVPSVPEVESL